LIKPDKLDDDYIEYLPPWSYQGLFSPEIRSLYFTDDDSQIVLAPGNFVLSKLHQLQALS
jgi:hypothetical protein